MDTPPGKPERLPRESPERAPEGSTRPIFRGLVGYFLKLGAIGFGGPVALVGYMHRDLVETRGWVSEDDYRLALTLAQIMPGPLAAQTAIAIGYFREGLLGATVGGLAFVLPSFLIVVAISAAYVAYGGLWWMQGLFYGIAAAVIGIISIAAFKLARSTNGRDWLLWGIFAAVLGVTYFTRTELAWLFILAGLVVVTVRAPPRWLRKGRPPLLGVAPLPFLVPLLAAATSGGQTLPALLLQLFLFFAKSGAFVFGSGLAIVPFLHQGVVQQYGWLTERQFLDAVAVAMITPGPVVITVVFIGYLVAGLAGAAVSAVGIFLPVYLLTVVPASWFKRHRDNPQLKAFVKGATAAATGALAAAVLILAQKAIVDVPTIAVAAVSLAVLIFVKVPEPILVAAAGAAGLAIWVLTGKAA
jgi:chromate transporter